MERGDVVSKDGAWYVVGQVSELGDCTLVDLEMGFSTAREEDLTYEVLANPYRDWPYVLLPHRFYRKGKLLSVGIPRSPSLWTPADDHTITPLRLYQDWLLGQPSRGGGALYLNPELGLGFLSRVSLTFAKETTSVTIPRTFVPVSQKAAAAKFSKAQPQKTFYDHLLSDDDED